MIQYKQLDKAVYIYIFTQFYPSANHGLTAIEDLKSINCNDGLCRGLLKGRAKREEGGPN